MDWSRKKTLIKRMGPFFGLGLFVTVLGLGLLTAHDLTHFFAERAGCMTSCIGSRPSPPGKPGQLCCSRPAAI